MGDLDYTLKRPMWRKDPEVWGAGPSGISPKAVEWLRRFKDIGRTSGKWGWGTLPKEAQVSCLVREDC